MPTHCGLSTGFSSPPHFTPGWPADAFDGTLFVPLPMKAKVSLKRTKFGGVAAIELKTPALRLVASTDRGPRIAVLSRPDGPNLLLWNPGKYGRGKWDLMGGHRLWVSRPGADEAEETYAADNQPCELETFANGFTVTAPTDPVLLTQRGFTVKTVAADRLEIEHFVTNRSNMLWSGGLWAITSTLPLGGTTYTVPLGDGSTWDYATVVAIRTWGSGQGPKTFNDPQFGFSDDAFHLHPAGYESKRMLKADPGIIGMHDPVRKLVFAKRAPYVPDANYPLGTNLALYIGKDNFMAEMESMGPFATVKPGHVLRHAETWVLRDAKAAPTAAQLKALF